MAESVRTIPPAFNFERALPTISAAEWRLHGGFLLRTIATTIRPGIVMRAPTLDAPEPPLTTPLDYLLYLPLSYLYWSAELFRSVINNPHLFVQGAPFW